MSDLLTQLRTYYNQLDEMAAPLADLEPRPKELTRQVSPRRRGWLIAAAAAFMVLVTVGGLALLLRPGDTESEPIDQPETAVTVAPTPAPTPAIIPAPATTTALPPSLSSVESWQQVGGDVMEPIAGLFDITRAGERLVAVGDDAGEDGRPDGVVLVSDDGFTWTRVAEDDEALTTGAVIMYAITEGGPGLVAVGGGCDDPEEACPIRATAWTSVDGTAWTRTPYDIEVFGTASLMEEVEVTEHGIVAVGRNTEVGDEGVMIRPAVWISPDGIEWARTWDGENMVRGLSTIVPDAGAFVLSPMQAITVGPDGTLVAVGTVVDEVGVGVAAVWTSDDGQTWERVPHDPEVFASSTGMDVVMLDVAAGESGLVAVGSERDHNGAGLWWTGGEQTAVWTSPDGTAWERITLDTETFSIGSISTVAASPTGFFAAGPIFADSGPVTIWTTPDGTAWQAVASFEGGYASSIIEAGPAMAVVGGVSHAAVWVGPQ